MTPNPQLNDFLRSYPDHIRQLTIEVRNYITSLIPEANELIWDNYNALAMAYSKSEVLKDAFCHVAVYGRHVNLGFNRGAELSQTSGIKLEGSGKLIRHIKIHQIADLYAQGIEKLIWEALGLSEARNENLIHKDSPGRSIVMSISDKKRRPN